VTPWLTFVLVSLAAYRVNHLVATDRIADPVRAWWYDRFDPGTSRPGRLAVSLTTCPWCLGVWTAGGVVLIVDAVYGMAAPVLVWAAAAAVVGVLGQLLE
jgi:hypothetical protein